MSFAERIVDWALSRQPDLVIGGRIRPYLIRWYAIPRNPLFNVYIHCIRRDDDDRALHDHPWVNCSIVLKGGYYEVTPGGRFWRAAGSVTFRRATAAHRLELYQRTECWSLFITGPRLRRWGFHCPKGWVDFKDFTDPNDPGSIGPGCGE